MEIGLYFHIPFCGSKCHYCDFLSFAGSKVQEAYIEALLKEMENTSKTLPSETRVTTLFIGGGTPTVLPPILLQRFLEGIVTYFQIDPTCEWTIEGNPGTIDEEKLLVMKQFPINRISLGLQATQDDLLKKIGRRHRFKDWEQSMALIRRHTDWAVNADLMFALPGQTLDDFKESLKVVANYDLEHLSVYALIIEEGTRFGDLYNQGLLEAVPEELDRQMYHEAQNFLKTKGYMQYEISNWAKPGKACLHNKVYWELKPYLGLGLGTHSFFDQKRYYNEEKIEKYIAAQGDLNQLRYEEEIVTNQMAMEEYLFLGLRCLEGISQSDFEKRFGKSVKAVYPAQIEKWMGLGLLKEKEDRLYLSSYGLDVCNEIFASFLA